MDTSLPKPTHALLIAMKQGSYLRPVLRAYAKQIVCLNKPKRGGSCGECVNCAKVDNDQYFDFIAVDSWEKGVAKEKVIEIQNHFMYEGLEQGKQKIYLIKEVERASKEAINSLLKFLEDPPSNTYAILTTKNENAVLPTIASRCQRFLLPQDASFDWKPLGDRAGVSPDDLQILSKLYWQIDDAIKAVEDKSYLETIAIAKGFLNPKKTLADLKRLQDQFKGLPYGKIELILNYLLFNLPTDRHETVLQILNAMQVNPIRNAVFWELVKATGDE